ncbi:hypothetical protein D3C86_1966890 [compost metagenome]
MQPFIQECSEQYDQQNQDRKAKTKQNGCKYPYHNGPLDLVTGLYFKQIDPCLEIFKKGVLDFFQLTQHSGKFQIM